MWHLHLEAVAVKPQHAVGLALNARETGHHEVAKNKKSIREIAGTLGVAKSTVWYILRENNALVC